MINVILDKIRPFARSIKYGRLLKRAQTDASKQGIPPLSPPVSFILGCGRSGTTILGKLLGSHDEVCYLFEPYHMWRAILPATDMIQLYGDNEARCKIDGDLITETEIQRFNACIHQELNRRGKNSRRVLEKTPINAMRIPMLNTLSPKSQVLHLVRNGVDVVRSIDRLASTNTYQMSGRGNWNQWWGRNNSKWTALASDADTMYPDEIDLLETDAQKGALEWLVSLQEIQGHKDVLGDRLLEIQYDDLTDDPRSQLIKICNHFGISATETWLDFCCNELDAARKNTGETLTLPPKMCAAFNEFQEEYGFEGRAETM